jgi:hypothetical protein
MKRIFFVVLATLMIGFLWFIFFKPIDKLTFYYSGAGEPLSDSTGNDYNVGWDREITLECDAAMSFKDLLRITSGFNDASFYQTLIVSSGETFLMYSQGHPSMVHFQYISSDQSLSEGQVVVKSKNGENVCFECLKLNNITKTRFETVKLCKIIFLVEKNCQLGDVVKARKLIGIQSREPVLYRLID